MTTGTTPRGLSDRYVEAVCDLDPITATTLGTRPGDDQIGRASCRERV